MKTVVAVVLLMLLSAAAAFFVARRYFPYVVTKTEIEYVDRDIVRRDTVTLIRPEIRTVFRTVLDTIRITVRVPIDFKPVGLIARNPIRFERDQIVLTFFADSSFVQDRFKIPKPTTSSGLFAFVGYVPIGNSVAFGLEAAHRYRSVSVYSRVAAYQEGQFFEIGLKLKIK